MQGLDFNFDDDKNWRVWKNLIRLKFLFEACGLFAAEKLNRDQLK